MILLDLHIPELAAEQRPMDLKRLVFCFFNFKATATHVTKNGGLVTTHIRNFSIFPFVQIGRFDKVKMTDLLMKKQHHQLNSAPSVKKILSDRSAKPVL